MGHMNIGTIKETYQELEQTFKENDMKKILAILAMVLILPCIALADSLSWTHDGADGFIVYYTDQTNNYNYNVIGDVRTCDLDLLNLAPGVEYTFHVTAYNETAESGPSNTVTYTREIFSPPANVLPVVSDPPGSPSGLQTL